MNKICALVILYNGTELTSSATNGIIAQMFNHGMIDDTDNVTVRFVDSETIANAILKEERTASKKAKKEKNALSEQLATAIAYIGTVCKDTLKYAKDTGHYTLFEIELKHAYISHQDMKKCVDLLATETFVLKKNLADEYNFSTKVLDIIKMIYNIYHR